MRNNKGNLICKFRHSLGTFSNSVHFGGLSNICHCIFVLLAAAAIIFTVAETGMALNSNDSQENAGPIIDATNVFLNTEWIYFTANELPMFYLDLDLEFDPDNNQGESLTIHLNDESEIAEDGLIYTSRAWVDEYGRMNIAWLGEKYLAVGDDVTKLSKYLVDFKPNENLTLELGDVWDMGEGYTLKFQDIDVNGEQAWFVFKKDGNPVEDIIASPEGVAGSLGGWGYYNDTLTGEYDVTIVMIHVDTIFEDKIIIDDAQVISLDVTELNQDKYYGLEFTNTANTLQLEEQDGTTSIDRGKRVEIIPDFLSIKVGDTQSDEPVRFYVFSEITPQELYKQHGPIINSTAEAPGSIILDANDLPMFYKDLDAIYFNPENNKGESLTINLISVDTIADNGIIYTSRAWNDANGRMNIAWLGEKYLAVGDDVSKLSKYLVDFQSDDNITLKQGDVWDIEEGLTLVVQDIDVNGEQVWMVLEQDGSPIEDIIASPEGVAGSLGGWGYYNDTLAGESDVVIARIHVDKVFEGMFESIVIIDNAEIISLNVTELNMDEYFGMDFDTTADMIRLTEGDGSTNISLGKTVEIIPDFLNIKVSDTLLDRFYVYREDAPDTIPPVITNIANNTPTTDSVTLTWYTDEDSDSRVKYGNISGNYTMQEFNTTMVTAHSITVTGLNLDTTYYFVVNSTDASGNAGQSSEYSFMTAAAADTIPPVI
ncbi:MAG: fibronectin type III domain-containing protein, partial [Methanosarcinales archaeon]|nr:fibronectin type III domain-containing protein [Methanosarcinales archaeon]